MNEDDCEVASEIREHIEKEVAVSMRTGLAEFAELSELARTADDNRCSTLVAPRVFISYSHDSSEHAARVLKLANALRRNGVDAVIDQYLTSPDEGWPLWMERHVREDDFVVMVCTPTYYRRVANQEKPGTGLGVRWEGSLIYNAIYKAEGDLSRFVPILPSGGRLADIPDRLVGGTHYDVDTPTGYEGLLRRLFNRPAAEMPPIGERPALPQLQAQWTTHPPPHFDWLAGLLTYPPSFVKDFFALVSGPKRFIAERSAAATLTVGRALGFLAVTILIKWAIPDPVHFHTSVMSQIRSDITFLFTQLIVYGLVLFLAWRSVGGKATLQYHLPIYLYFSAVYLLLFQVVISTLLGVLHTSDQKLYSDIMQSFHKGFALQYTLSAEYRDAVSKSPNILFVAVAGIFGGSLIITWVIAGWGAYRVLNDVSRLRSVIAAFVFFILSMLTYGVLAVLAEAFIAAITDFAS